MSNQVHFKPNPAQERFLRAFRPGRELLLCSGVGIGKTYILGFAANRLAWLNPGVGGLVVSHVLGHARTEIVPIIIEHLRASGLYAGETKQDRVIHLRHGGYIQYGSAERADTLDGKNVGWLLGDEIRYWPQASYIKAIARVRVKAARYPMKAFTTTPDMNWIYDEFARKPGKIVLHGASHENADNVLDGYYENMVHSMDADTYSQYVEGNWVSAKDTVYGKSFSEDECVQDLGQVYTEPVMMGMDPGIRSPAVVFFQHLEWCHRHKHEGRPTMDCIHVLGEIVRDDTPIEEMIQLIHKEYERNAWKRGDMRIYLDPFGGNQRDQIAGQTVAKKLKDAGFRVVFSYDKRTTNVLNGIRAVSGQLLNVSGQRRLFIDKSLAHDYMTPRNLIRALQSYRWPERKSGQAIKNEPVHDEASHIMDALRYPIVNLFPPVIDYVGT